MRPMNRRTVYSVGHSNGDLVAFIELLRQSEVETLVDIRSQPYSRYAPQFNLEALERAVRSAGIRFEYMGRELGGRPVGREFYDGRGHVDYARLAQSHTFDAGLRDIIERAGDCRLALMFSEESPESCHRRLLIGRVL